MSTAGTSTSSTIFKANHACGTNVRVRRANTRTRRGRCIHERVAANVYQRRPCSYLFQTRRHQVHSHRKPARLLEFCRRMRPADRGKHVCIHEAQPESKPACASVSTFVKLLPPVGVWPVCTTVSGTSLANGERLDQRSRCIKR